MAVLVAAQLVVATLSRPIVGWDVVPYTMATLKTSTSEAAELHARTWAVLKERLPANLVNELTTGDFRADQYRNPQAAVSQLPLYESKYGYVALLKAASAVVGNPVDAIIAVSLIGGLGTLVCLVYAASRIGGIAALLWVPLAKVFDLSPLAAQTVPDSLEAFTSTAGTLALLARRPGLATGLLVCGVLVRPDNLILNAFLCVVVATASLRWAAILGVLSLSAGFVDVFASHHIGWWGQYQYNFISKPSDLAQLNPVFSFSAYAHTELSAIVAIARSEWAMVMIGTWIAAIALLAGSKDREPPLLLLAIVATFVVRLCAYPSIEFRHYAPLQFAGAVLLLTAVAARRPGVTGAG
jgi:hypothetical protein